MVLHPALHAEIMANVSSNVPYIAPIRQIGHDHMHARNTFVIDRNNMVLSLYGYNAGGTEVVVAEASHKSKSGASIPTNLYWWPWTTGGVIAAGAYAPGPASVPAGHREVVYPIARIPTDPPSSLTMFMTSGAFGIPTPDSSTFDAEMIWSGVGRFDPGIPELGSSCTEHAADQVSMGGLRRMPFNTCGMQAVILESGVIPTRFELRQKRFITFDTWYYENFVDTEESTSLMSGPYKSVENALIYGGSVGYVGSSADLVFSDMSWSAGDVIAIPEIVLTNDQWLEVVRYAG